MRLRMPIILGLSAVLAPAVAAADSTPRRTPPAVAAAIDSAIDGALAEQKIPASPQADDAEFLRRVYLDLTGAIPTTEQASAFLDGKDPEKRSKLIDELLASPLYGRHFGTLWHNRIVPLSPENTRNFDKPLFLWLANGFNDDRPWSKTVSELLLAEGEREKNPALGFYLSPANSVENFVQADRVAGSVAQLFLGANLRCAQCHNHPFAKWKQTEFWGVAAFFGRVGYPRETKEFLLTESRKIRNKDNQPVETARDDASIPLPGKNKFVKARFLGGDEPALAPDASFRGAFVAWLTAPENDRFNKAAVNRLKETAEHAAAQRQMKMVRSLSSEEVSAIALQTSHDFLAAHDQAWVNPDAMSPREQIIARMMVDDGTAHCGNVPDRARAVVQFLDKRSVQTALKTRNPGIMDQDVELRPVGAKAIGGGASVPSQ